MGLKIEATNAACEMASEAAKAGSNDRCRCAIRPPAVAALVPHAVISARPCAACGKFLMVANLIAGNANSVPVPADLVLAARWENLDSDAAGLDLVRASLVRAPRTIRRPRIWSCTRRF